MFFGMISGSQRAAHVLQQSGEITHGEQLIRQGDVGVNVGPTALIGASGYPGTLETMSLPGRGYWRGDTPDEFAPTGDYIYNNSSTNHGGVVPVGGVTIDGYQIAAGTRVVQFRDFSAGDIFLNNSTNFLFRGCRFRHTNRAPGDFNTNVANTGSLNVFYCDMGGLGAQDEDYNEIPIKISAASTSIIHRNYLSYTTTAIQFNIGIGSITENFIENITYYYGPNPPPGESTDKHLNGIKMEGAAPGMQVKILRNKILAQNPDGAGRTVSQTDCIGLIQFTGTFEGDGTIGIQIKDNYMGGTGYCIYAGKNSGSASDSVQNLVLTGNKITTQWYSTGGSFGPITAEPTWGTLGNVKSNNTWADGPNQGQEF